jgi:alkanesulfonate monooxygenase SsuD/methylene tetrahydromethanopterin reductase-like flavin-dependent oxidoreductase (luciferase family)
MESFPLFGYDLADYEALFEEKTELFAELLQGGAVSWQGTTRPALHGADVVPHLESGPFPVWIGVGGSPESVVRAARYGFGLMLAIIGGSPARFAPFSQLFAAALDEFGHPPRPVGVHAPGHIAETDEQARDELGPHYRDVLTRVGRQPDWAPPTKSSSSARQVQTAPGRLGRRRLSPAGSPPTCRRSAPPASISNTAWSASRTTRSCAPSSCTAPRSSRSPGNRWPTPTPYPNRPPDGRYLSPMSPSGDLNSYRGCRRTSNSA